MMIDNPDLERTKKPRIYPVNRVIFSCLLLPAVIANLALISSHDFSRHSFTQLISFLTIGAIATLLCFIPALAIGATIIHRGQKKACYLSDQSESAQKAEITNKLPVGKIVAVPITALVILFMIPNYCDYTGRTHVSEGLAMASSVKFSIAEYYLENKRWPKDNHEAGLAENIIGNAVQSIKIINNGAIIITYNKKVKEGVELILTPTFVEEKKEMTWRCTTNAADSKKAINNRDLPSSCRNNQVNK